MSLPNDEIVIYCQHNLSTNQVGPYEWDDFMGTVGQWGWPEGHLYTILVRGIQIVC